MRCAQSMSSRVRGLLLNHTLPYVRSSGSSSNCSSRLYRYPWFNRATLDQLVLGRANLELLRVEPPRPYLKSPSSDGIESTRESLATVCTL
nr:hypothetical protein CFP56_24073 [Quercus suber]